MPNGAEPAQTCAPQTPLVWGSALGTTRRLSSTVQILLCFAVAVTLGSLMLWLIHDVGPGISASSLARPPPRASAKTSLHGLQHWAHHVPPRFSSGGPTSDKVKQLVRRNTINSTGYGNYTQCGTASDSTVTTNTTASRWRQSGSWPAVPSMQEISMAAGRKHPATVTVPKTVNDTVTKFEKTVTKFHATETVTDTKVPSHAPITCSATYTSIGPDRNDPYCICSDETHTETRPINTGTGEGGKACPETWQPPPSTGEAGGSGVWQYTSTDQTQTIMCEYAHTISGAGWTSTECDDWSSALTIYTPKPTQKVTATLSVGPGVYVGGFTGANFSTALSSAIYHACSETTIMANTLTEKNFPAYTSVFCVSNATIEEVPYPDNSGEKTKFLNGSILMGFAPQKFQNMTMASKMADVTAQWAMLSFKNTDSACDNWKVWDVNSDNNVRYESYNYSICRIPKGIVSEAYDGIQTDGPTDALWVTFEFRGADMNVRDVAQDLCDSIKEFEGILTTIFEILFPPIAPALVIANRLVGVACDAIEKGNEALSALQSLQSVGTSQITGRDARLIGPMTASLTAGHGGYVFTAA